MPKLKKKLKGMEAMQVALLVVIAVVIVLALYFVASQFIASTPAPALQIDPYGSTFSGTQVIITLKVGTSIDSISQVQIIDPRRPGTALCTISGSNAFTPAGPYSPGDTITGTGTCTNAPPRGVMYQVRITYTAGGTQRVLVLNWQT